MTETTKTETTVCPICGSAELGEGKLTGIAALQPLNARSGLFGSEVLMQFCRNCGEVLHIKVKNPEKVPSVSE